MAVDIEGPPVIHRIQLKLGASEITVAEKDKIFQRFNSMKGGAVNAYSTSLGVEAPVHKWYLMTTRSMKPTLREDLEKGNVMVLDARFLRENVWTEQVRELGSVYRR